MTSSKRFGFLILAGLFTAASLSGCGGSSEEDRIPTTVTVFNQHSIVFGNNSSVLTTGYNGFGQLGDGTRDNRAFAAPVPGLGRMGGFAAGAAHTLAFTNNSTVMAWGFNQFGQLGTTAVRNGAESSSLDFSPVPVQVELLNRVTSVAAGAYHSLAVSDGHLYGWGGNGSGQLGNNTLTNAYKPVEVLKVVTAGVNEPFTNATQVAAGALHSLVLTQDNKVWAWGDNTFGQLGSAAGTPKLSPVEVVFLKAPVGTFPIRIAAAGRYSAALMNDGSVYTWGYNEYGQLGLGTRVATEVPTQVVFPVPAGQPQPFIAEISAGLMHMLARAGNTIWGWGFNERAQLGNNPVIGVKGQDPNTGTPVRAQIGGAGEAGAGFTVESIQAFGYSSLATLINPGTGLREIWGWGENSFGQLGSPVNKNGLGYRSIPVRMEGL